MARKKTDIQDATETQENVQDVQDTVTEEVVTEGALVGEQPQNQEETQVKQKTDVNSDEIPAFVDKLLKTYARYSALYVDAKGGVYTEDAQPIVRGDAILYQNPYYKQ